MTVKKNNISKIINIVITISIVALVLNFLTSKLDKVFEIVGYRTYTIVSGSMEPEFYPGDIVVVKHKSRTDIKINDIVTFVDNDGIVVTHRIIEKVDNGYITKGDNNNVEDTGILNEENIIGEVKYHIPNMGKVVSFLSNPKVMSIELILLGIFIFYCYKD